MKRSIVYLLLAHYGPDKRATRENDWQLSGKTGSVCSSWRYSHSWKSRGREQLIGRQPESRI